MYQIREVSRGNYDDRGYTNESSIAALMLQRPEELNQTLIYSYGMDDDRFTLTFLTEGQGEVGVKDIGTVEWTWKTMGRMKFNDCVTYFNTANTTPGKGGAIFEVHFASHWLIEQYGLVAPDGRTQVRIMRDCGKSAYGYKYLLKLTYPSDPASYVDPALLAKGKFWTMTAPTISESYSKGNRSNSMGPGKMKSQLGFHRFSKEIAGNAANTVVEYQFKTSTGGTTNLWMNEEMRQFEVQKMIMMEEWMWLSHYNRNAQGEVLLTDMDNDEPIPHTAGMFEIAEEANYDTYGETLPLQKLERTIGDVLTKDTDTGSMEIVVYAGKGALHDFDNAIKDDAKGQGFATPLGDKMIETMGDGMLSYGKYFRRYRTVDGHIITLSHLPFLDNGTLAENDKANGNLHPRTGLPLCSHQMICVDHSTYNGEKNVRMVRQKGQAYKTGILKGLTDVPASWGVLKDNAIGTEIDKSKYEVKLSKGLQVNNADKMFAIRCVL